LSPILQPRLTSDKKLANYSENKKYGYEIFINTLKHFIGIKLLLNQGAETFAKDIPVRDILNEPRTASGHESRLRYVDYLKETLRMQQPHNLDYNFNLPEVFFRYQYTVRAHEEAREGIKRIRRRSKDIEMYDFLQLYKNIKLDSTISLAGSQGEGARQNPNEPDDRQHRDR